MLDSQKIVNHIVSSCSGKEVWVAYSGGVDSHVLLHLLATSQDIESNMLHALHINHGLHVESKQWVQHCSNIADDLNVDFTALEVEVKNIDTLGMEAAARVARYGAIKNHLTSVDIVLTAQHQHDQAETVLLQLLRGAGPKGLSAMASQFLLGETQVFRPLLNSSQAEILDYARQHQLQWINDPSNVEIRWNRNYIRHTLWPEIELRWPAAAKTLSRSAGHCAEAAELMAELAVQDLAVMKIDNSNHSLPVSLLLSLSPMRYKNVLRYFIELKQLPLPSTASLQRVIDEVCLAKHDGMPMVSWAGVEVRRFQDKLYFMAPLIEHDIAEQFECNHIKDLSLNDGRILFWQQRTGEGFSQELIASGLTIRYRQGGEKIKLQNQSHHKSLKHLFQQWEVPPWMRSNIPLIYCGNELICVVGYALATDYAVASDEQGLTPLLKLDE